MEYVHTRVAWAHTNCRDNVVVGFSAMHARCTLWACFSVPRIQSAHGRRTHPISTVSNPSSHVSPLQSVTTSTLAPILFVRRLNEQIPSMNNAKVSYLISAPGALSVDRIKLGKLLLLSKALLLRAVLPFLTTRTACGIESFESMISILTHYISRLRLAFLNSESQMPHRCGSL